MKYWVTQKNPWVYPSKTTKWNSLANHFQIKSSMDLFDTGTDNTDDALCAKVLYDWPDLGIQVRF